MIVAIAKKESFEKFSSPLAYVFFSVFLLLSAWLFFSSFFVFGQATLRDFFSWLPLLFLVFLPALTMGLWADEKRSGTWELLMTSSLSEVHLILGKWLSAIFFLVLTLLGTLPLVLTVMFLGPVDLGQVITGYLGAFLLGLLYLSFGLFVSSLFKNSIVAFLITLVFLFFFYLIGETLVTSHVPQSVALVLQALSPAKHFVSMTRGVIDLRDVLYFVSISTVFVYFNYLSLKVQRLK